MFEKLESHMFDNVGQKIKTIVRYYVRIMVSLLLIAAVALEVYALTQLPDGNGEAFLMMLLIPFAAALAGVLVWLSAVPIYGFGEVVDTAIAMRGEEEVPLDSLPNLFDGEPAAETDSDEPAPDDEWICPACEGEVTYSAETKVWHCAHCHRRYTVVGEGWTQRLKEL